MADSESKSTHPTDDQQAEEALTGEQEEALKKIMAELNTGASTVRTPADDPSAESEKESSNELTSEQEEALKKIMAEIEGNQESGTALQDAASQDPPPGLVDEQQENLDKIIAELRSATVPDSSKEAIQDDNELLAEELSNEQEAALNKIMAEIEGHQPDGQPNQKAASGTHGQPGDPSAAGNLAENETGVADGSDPTNGRPSDGLAPGLSPADFESELQKVVAEAGSQGATAEPVAPPSPASTSHSDDRPEAAGALDGGAANDPVPQALDETPKADAPQAGQAIDPEPVDPDPNPEPVLSGAAADQPAVDSPPAADPVPADLPSPAPAPKIVAKSSVRPKPTARTSKITSLAAVGKGLKIKKGRWMLAAAALGILLVLGFLAAARFQQNPGPAILDSDRTSVDGQVHFPSQSGPAIPAQAPPAAALTGSMPSDAERLTMLSQDIEGLRAVLLSKRKEIEELKGSYRQGIAEAQGELSIIIREQNPTTYAKAMQDQRIELGLRTIQRRQDYIVKLDSPDAQLLEASEELLYLQRKADILHRMLEDTSGISLDAFEKQVAETLDRIGLAQERLSIDDVAQAPPSLESVWNWVVGEASKSKAADGQRPVQEKANQQIASEICSGRFERKYELSELTEETARCLIQWNGKDLYLNHLSQLSPEAAKILSQWKGEWLGLNGLTRLSPEAARYLALWKGKRLSLNGLSELSPGATQYLAQWTGDQLELINLKHMGQWDNPKITLFVSDQLRARIPD